MQNRWYTRHEWKTKPGIRTDGWIVLIHEKKPFVASIEWVDDSMDDIPKCWRWAKGYDLVKNAAIKDGIIKP